MRKPGLVTKRLKTVSRRVQSSKCKLDNCFHGFVHASVVSPTLLYFWRLSPRFVLQLRSK